MYVCINYTWYVVIAQFTCSYAWWSSWREVYISQIGFCSPWCIFVQSIWSTGRTQEKHTSWQKQTTRILQWCQRMTPSWINIEQSHVHKACCSNMACAYKYKYVFHFYYKNRKCVKLLITVGEHCTVTYHQIHLLSVFASVCVFLYD